MCGRTCLTLHPDDIIKSCKYKSKTLSQQNEKLAANTLSSAEKGTKYPEVQSEGLSVPFIFPKWRPEYNCGRNYTPSYNIAPTDITPVLVSSSHFENDISKDGPKRIVVPMMWGMIPAWHKGDYKKHGMATNNCRLENIKESKLYGGPLCRGQRCVVICEGFYEWQTTEQKKSPNRAAYLIYEPQMEGVHIYDKATWSAENVNLLKMAALFDVWINDDGDKMFSYSVITFEAPEIFSWLHHRIPAILETDDQVEIWLNYKDVPYTQALSILRPATRLHWHRVSSIVNNSRNKSEECNKPVELCKSQEQNSKESKMLLAWLKKGK